MRRHYAKLIPLFVLLTSCGSSSETSRVPSNQAMRNEAPFAQYSITLALTASGAPDHEAVFSAITALDGRVMHEEVPTVGEFRYKALAAKDRRKVATLVHGIEKIGQVSASASHASGRVGDVRLDDMLGIGTIHMYVYESRESGIFYIGDRASAPLVLLDYRMTSPGDDEVANLVARYVRDRTLALLSN